ncbi:DUF58 domain-containing protein [Cytobacillus horneckiae]|uniref:DUF58 domain-containing protein n=1 Tax=Cytobacillus horneckiae TaxID=549687 RepID=UPI0034CD1F33
MSIWKKEIIEDQFLSIISLLSIVLLFASFYFQSALVFFSAVFILLLLYANSFYLKHVGGKLLFIDERKRTRHFPNDEGQWAIIMENKGLPIMSGHLKITFNQVVRPIDENLNARQEHYEMSIPFSINYKERKEIIIPFITNKRGMAKLRKVELHLPHFFGLGETILQYKYLTKQEVLVYPRAISVKNKSVFLTNKQGESYAKHSLFEDSLSPAGTRNYVNTDSFNQIHWKASAKNQQLQTKIYDRTNETGWNISLNIAVSHSISKKMEELISSAADLAYFFEKNDIQFSVCINIRATNHIPFLYIPAGKGKEHLQKVLELLAIADSHGSIYPYEKMLSYYGRHLQQQPFFLHGGFLSDKAASIFHEMNTKGYSIYHLQTTKQSATIIQHSLPKKEVQNL